MPKFCADIENYTRNDSEPIDNSVADANLEYKEAAMNKKTDTPIRDALGRHDPHLAKNRHLRFFPSPSCKETLFRPKRTRHDHDHDKLDLDRNAKAGHQHAILLHIPSSRTRAAVISICFILAAASAFYESSKTYPRRHSRFDAHNNYISLRLETLQHLACNIAPLLIFTAATAVVYHLNTSHRFQDLFVLVGLVFGVVAGMVKYRDLQHAMLRAMPWGVVAAQGASMAVHRAWDSGIEEPDMHVMLV